MKNNIAGIKILGVWMMMLILTACAPKQSTIISSQVLNVVGERPPLDADLAMLAPDGLQGVSWVNLQEIRTSPIWPTLKFLLNSYYSESLLSKDFVLSTLNKADEVFTASGHRSPDEPDGFVALLKGDWDTDVILKQLVDNKRLRARTIGQKKLKIRNIDVFAVSERTLAIVSDHLEETVTLCMARKTKTLRDTPVLQKIEMPKKAGAASLYVRGDGLRKNGYLEYLPPAYGRLSQKVQHASARLHFGEGISFRANAIMDDAENATEAASRVNQELKSISSNVLIAMLGVKSLIKKIKIDAKGNRLKTSVGFSLNDVDKLKQLIEPIMQIRNMVN
ncbi:MAG: hypothetical protein JXR76_26850 [Deltaproteobacteria bacterium]|nr:hypothetical protein [Deltaproteobacteria bacterium]